jgi:hypothetical protein
LLLLLLTLAQVQAAVVQAVQQLLQMSNPRKVCLLHTPQLIHPAAH